MHCEGSCEDEWDLEDREHLWKLEILGYGTCTYICIYSVFPVTFHILNQRLHVGGLYPPCYRSVCETSRNVLNLRCHDHKLEGTAP